MWRSWRFYLILVISLLGLFLTQYWYDHSEIDYGGGESAPVAFVHEKQNVVEQKYVDHLIWKAAGTGQILYQGDTIRTSPNSEVEVVFTKSGTSFVLNEDSQVVIDERKGETTLTLLNGSLLAKGNGKAPTVIVGNSKVHLEQEKTEVEVSVNKKKEVVGCVYSGAVNMAAAGEKGQSFQSGNCSAKNVLVTLSPKPNEVIAQIGKLAPIPFKFVGHSFSYEADLFIGKKKDLLKKVSTVKSQSSSGVIEVLVPEGSFYWQVLTRNGEKEIARSFVQQAEVLTLSAPVLGSPPDASVFTTDQSSMSVSLGWSSPNYAKTFHVEVSKDISFDKNKIFDGTSNNSEKTVLLPRNPVYYWRVTAIWKNEKLSPLMSGIRKFSINPLSKLTPPKLMSPHDGYNVGIQSLNRIGANLTWSPVADASSYSVQVVSSNGKTQQFEVNDPSYRLKQGQVGEIKWAVRSKNPSDVSLFSPFGHFTVVPYDMVKWIKPKSSEMQVETETPRVELEWGTVEGVSEWTLSYDSVDLKRNYSSKYRDNKTTLELQTVGSWHFQVSGHDEKGNLLAKSEAYSLHLTAVGLLLAPVLVGVSTSSLKSEADGSVKVHWNAVQGAKSYLLVLTDPSGKESRVETRDTRHGFENLSIGKHALKIKAINAQGKSGLSGAYEIEVLDVFGTTPPTIKRVIVH